MEDVPYDFDLVFISPEGSKQRSLYWVKDPRCTLVNLSEIPNRTSGDTIWWQPDVSNFSVSITTVIHSNSGMTQGTVFNHYAEGSYALVTGYSDSLVCEQNNPWIDSQNCYHPPVYTSYRSRDTLINRLIANKRIGNAHAGLPETRGMQWRRIIDTAYFAGGGQTEPRYIAPFGDGHFILAMSELVVDGNLKRRTSIFKVKKENGEIAWRKNFVEPNSDHVILSVEAGADSGIYGFGNRDSDAWIVRLDKDANTLFNKNYGGTGYDHLTKAVVSVNGDIVVMGQTSSPPEKYPSNKLWLMRLDKSGNELLSKIIPVVNSGTFQPVDMLLDEDGTVIVFANLQVQNESKQMFIKLDSNFNILTSKFVSQLNRASIKSAAKAPDGGFIITGSFTDLVVREGNSFEWDYDVDIWLIKTDREGNWQWEKYYGGSVEDRGIQVKPSKNGFVVAAQTLSRNGNVTDFNLMDVNGWLFETDSVGSLLWQTTLDNLVGDLGGNYEHDLGSFLILPDQSIMGFGFCDQPSENLYSDVIFKIGTVSSITGKAYMDMNKNGTKDGSEPVLNGLLVKTSKEKTSIAKTIVNGRYLNTVDTGMYTTKLLYSNEFYKILPPTHTSNIQDYGTSVTADFAVQPIKDIQDLNIGLIPINRIRPGMAASYIVEYENSGTISITDATISFVKDHLSIFDSSSMTVQSIVGDTIKWNIGTINPLEKGAFTVHLTTAIIPDIQLGDTFRVEAAIYPIVNDSIGYNNVAKLAQVVVGSFDPNDKNEKHGSILPIEKIADKDNLVYTIRFQNMGSDTAFNILVSDTLRRKVDFSSVQNLYSSHNAQFTISQDSILEWRFNQIKLPYKSEDEAGSQGYVTFRVMADSLIHIGDSITNAASIYFDFNPPVITNLHILKVKSSNANVCPGGNTELIALLKGTAYQWQINTGSGFNNITNGGVYNGATNATLLLNNVSSSLYRNEYRCQVTTANGKRYSETYKLAFVNTWIGTTSSAWETASNWSCGSIPDATTDVVVKANTIRQPQVSSTTATCRSITINTGAHVWIKADAGLNVTAK